MGKERIGFIGMGIMGEPMARNLLRAGYPVTVFSRTKSKKGPAGPTLPATWRKPPMSSSPA